MLDAYEDMEEEAGLLIPHPQNEPVIGVIDTQFNEKEIGRASCRERV